MRGRRAESSDNLVRVRDVVEKPKPEEAPSNLGIMGRYVFTPAIFDAIDRTEPGRGNEIQLTDAIKLLLETEAVYGYTFSEGRFDVGNKLDFLRATVELRPRARRPRPAVAGLARRARPAGSGP